MLTVTRCRGDVAWGWWLPDALTIADDVLGERFLTTPYQTLNYHNVRCFRDNHKLLNNYHILNSNSHELAWIIVKIIKYKFHRTAKLGKWALSKTQSERFPTAVTYRDYVQHVLLLLPGGGRYGGHGFVRVWVGRLSRHGGMHHCITFTTVEHWCILHLKVNYYCHYFISWNRCSVYYSIINQYQLTGISAHHET